MENTRDKYKALLASLGVHLVIFFVAAAVGIFSMAAVKQTNDNIEVVVYDEVQDEGSEGGGSPPQVEAVPAVDEVVIPDKTLPPIEQTMPEEKEKPSQKREARAGNPMGQGGEGKG
ncbi:MAG: energy transducer TonB, partial [Selenomonas sp.]